MGGWQVELEVKAVRDMVNERRRLTRPELSDTSDDFCSCVHRCVWV